MKTVKILVLMCLPMLSLAEVKPVESRQYGDCLPWMTVNSTESSRKFLLSTATDGTVIFDTFYYDRSALCEGAPDFENSYKIVATSTKGDESIRIIEGQDLETKLYFRVMITPIDAKIHFSKESPVKATYSNMIYLKRMN